MDADFFRTIFIAPFTHVGRERYPEGCGGEPSKGPTHTAFDLPRPGRAGGSTNATPKATHPDPSLAGLTQDDIVVGWEGCITQSQGVGGWNS